MLSFTAVSHAVNSQKVSPSHLKMTRAVKRLYPSTCSHRAGPSSTSSHCRTSAPASRSSTDSLKVSVFPSEGRDLPMCLTDVRLLPSAGTSFQWEFVRGLLESAIYGGRIDNPSDLRILRSYLEQFFSSQLLSSSSSSSAHRKSRSGSRCFPPQISLPSSCSAAVRWAADLWEVICRISI